MPSCEDSQFPATSYPQLSPTHNISTPTHNCNHRYLCFLFSGQSGRVEMFFPRLISILARWIETGTVPLVEGCGQTAVTPQRRAQEMNTQFSLFSLTSASHWQNQMEARGQGSPRKPSIKFQSPRTQGRGKKIESRPRRSKENIQHIPFLLS